MEPLLPRCRTSSTAASAPQLLLLLSLFALWGACNALNDVLIQTFKDAFTLSDAQSSLVQTAFYFGYLFGGVPAACVARRFGYKVCVCTGLSLVCTGSALFYPFSRGEQPWYWSLLGCLYLLAFGLAFLECSANPWIVLLGERRRTGFGTRALNMAQSCNPIGSIFGVLLGRQMILRGAAEERVAAVGCAYLVIAGIFAAVACAFALVRFPAGDGRQIAGRAPLRCTTLAGCVRRRGFACGVLAQFLNIGAQTCTWSFTIRYMRAELPGESAPRGADALLLSLCLFLAGRLSSTALLRCVRADVLLALQSLVAMSLSLLAALAGGPLGLVALVLVSPCFGMAFPTIFA